MAATVPIQRLHSNQYIAKLTSAQRPRSPDLPEHSYDGGRAAYNMIRILSEPRLSPSADMPHADDCLWAPHSFSRFGTEAIVTFVNHDGMLARLQVLPARLAAQPNVRFRAFNIHPDVARFISSYYRIPELLTARICGYWTYDHADEGWVQRDVYDEAYNSRNDFGGGVRQWVHVQ